MIKLVSQFDNENSKLSLATPTCGPCCCCCCCCIITTLVTASISKRNFGQYLVQLNEKKTKQKFIVPKIILRLIGYFIYVLVSIITMWYIIGYTFFNSSAPWDDGFNDTKFNFFNYTIKLTNDEFYIFALILVVISIFLLKKEKNQDISNENSEQFLTKVEETKPKEIVSKKSKNITGFKRIIMILFIIFGIISFISFLTIGFAYGFLLFLIISLIIIVSSEIRRFCRNLRNILKKNATKKDDENIDKK